MCWSQCFWFCGVSDCDCPSTDVPGPPKDLRVTDITRSTVRLIWKLPDSDGGERIKSYFIEKKCITDKAWTKVNTVLIVFKVLVGKYFYLRCVIKGNPPSLRLIN